MKIHNNKQFFFSIEFKAKFIYFNHLYKLIFIFFFSKKIISFQLKKKKKLFNI
jgi:hypothetical protein